MSEAIHAKTRKYSYVDVFAMIFCPFSVYIDFVTDKALSMLRRVDPTVLERTFEVKLTQITSYSPMR